MYVRILNIGSRMVGFRSISWSELCKKYVAHPCIASCVYVREQNLRNDDVTRETLGTVGLALRRISLHANVGSL